MYIHNTEQKPIFDFRFFIQSEKPPKPWIVAEKDGKIIVGHCTCMAGLGEACSHMPALLFAIDTTVKIRDSKTVTEEPVYWLCLLE
jgi:hypothetical protein